MKAPEHRKWLAVAKELAATGRVARAIGIWIRVAKFYAQQDKLDKAILLVRRATHERKTKKISVWLRLIWLEAKSQNMEKAVDYATRTARLIGRKRRASSYLDLADRLFSSFPQCREALYLTLLQLDRTTARFFVRAAQAMIEQRKFVQAKEMALRAAATHTDVPEVAHVLGTALNALGETSNIAHVRRWAKNEISPEDLALIVAKKRRPERAEESIELSTPSLSRENTNRGELKDLIEALEEELGVDPDTQFSDVRPLAKEFRERARPILASDSKTRVDLALAFSEMGLVHEALDELDSIRDSEPIYLEAQALKARFLSEDGSHLKALDTLQRAIRLGRASEAIWLELNYQLIHVFRHLGDVQKAWEALQAVEKRAPLYRDLRFLKQDLATLLDERKKQKA